MSTNQPEGPGDDLEWKLRVLKMCESWCLRESESGHADQRAEWRFYAQVLDYIRRDVMAQDGE
jgi:hypothetical protein